MRKLLLLSLMMATLVIPIIAARDPLPSRGFRRALVVFLVFCFGYSLALKYVFFHL
ncbi:MAG: hypothetical protein JST92_18075 [Deltaproteobacteria bacterium]|nr:hypothetical protein [Deltaproteobacteria bacterium]